MHNSVTPIDLSEKLRKTSDLVTIALMTRLNHRKLRKKRVITDHQSRNANEIENEAELKFLVTKRRTSRDRGNYFPAKSWFMISSIDRN